jgi:uncharacterized protein YjbJ (UPF0337 family)
LTSSSNCSFRRASQPDLVLIASTLDTSPSVSRRAADPEEATVGDDDKLEGKVDELTGKAKESVGDATGNEDLQAEGRGDQVKGDLKQAGEKIKDAFKT